MTEPLAEGEHIDLDTGAEVKRLLKEGNTYLIDKYNRKENRTEFIFLEDEEIRQIAELAGYKVSER